MQYLSFLLFGFGIFFSNGQVNVDIENKPQVLFDFEKPMSASENWAIADKATYEIVEQAGSKRLKVNSSSFGMPKVTLFSTKSAPWNLQGYYKVKADISNAGSNDLQIVMYVGDDPNSITRWYCSQYVDLEPNETKTVTVELAWTPWITSPQLDISGMRGVPGQLKTDIGAIDQIAFDTRVPTRATTFYVDNIRVEEQLEIRDGKDFFPFVDKFGQYKHEDWKNKIHDKEDLKKQDLIEQKDLSKNPGPKDRSQYGGWKNGPKLKATGFFRTEKYKGKWWMVDPEGYLFWTAGLNCMAPKSSNTGIQYREEYFEALPDEKPYEQFYGTSGWAPLGFYKDKTPYKTFSFYQSNLYKKYGDDWMDQFRDRIHTRLKSWGLNTIGFVSDYGAAQQRRTPYVGSVWIRDTPKIEASSGFWGKFHDVFAPEFSEIVHSSVEEQREGANDPWCIGFFVDNELSWGGERSLAVSVLQSPASQPAKVEFIKDLRKKYKNIESLNAAWLAEYESWDDLSNSIEAPDENNAKEDLDAFYKKIADTYFGTISKELKRVAPNQNYLGCRFAWSNNVTLSAATKYCEIISFNMYEFSVEKVALPLGMDHPIMIGEFHFGATDRGQAHPGVKMVNNQVERGEAFQEFIEGALRNEQIVGAHWFQYLDEPFTGRGDGENYNTGFIDVGDTPHQELIEKVRETCYDLYKYRFEN
ncbi:MAG: hypothetical protein JXR03_02265 [Cyclobacteriaceae bacterium]